MKSILLRGAKFSLIGLFGLSLIGCASVTMPHPSATPSTVEKLRSANLVPSKVGKFGLAAGLDPSMDKMVGGLRGSTVQGSKGSYSQQLRDVVMVELKAAGLYDENSDILIGAELTDSQVDAAITTGSAKLGANFTVDKAGNRIFEKNLSVSSTWKSSFVGAIAIPAAINEYSALYKKLAAKLFEDKDFREALAK